MFEGKPPRPEDGSALRPAAQREELRPLVWSDLASRLAAARDLRVSLAPGERDGEASFDALSARWIAAHPADEDGVNPEDSANRKGTGATWAEAPAASRDGAARD
jgi:hypothetical protein